MDSAKFPQPVRHETTCEAKCSKCGAVVYTESLVEENGVNIERIVCGSFRQALTADGEPTGPVIPFCNCKG